MGLGYSICFLVGPSKMFLAKFFSGSQRHPGPRTPHAHLILTTKDIVCSNQFYSLTNEQETDILPADRNEIPSHTGLGLQEYWAALSPCLLHLCRHNTEKIVQKFQLWKAKKMNVSESFFMW